jgi:RNA polymerase sigma-70 factor, ECF subfamily
MEGGGSLALGEAIGPELVSDDQLVVDYRNGDIRAFDVLFARHHAAVYRFAYLLVQDQTAAEEILQDTFLAVARAICNYQCHDHFRTWLMRIVRNRCLNWRESSRIRSCRRDYRDPELLELACAAAGPDQVAEGRDELEQLQRAIARLPERQQESLLLHAMQGMTYQQVAEVMELPINTVKTLIHRARANLCQARSDEVDV